MNSQPLKATGRSELPRTSQARAHSASDSQRVLCKCSIPPARSKSTACTSMPRKCTGVQRKHHSSSSMKPLKAVQGSSLPHLRMMKIKSQKFDRNIIYNCLDLGTCLKEVQMERPAQRALSSSPQRARPSHRQLFVSVRHEVRRRPRSTVAITSALE